MVLDAKFAKGTSYRAFRFDWTGTPTDRPAVAAGRTKAGHPAIYGVHPALQQPSLLETSGDARHGRWGDALDGGQLTQR